MAEVSDRYIPLEDFKFVSVFYELKINLNIAQEDKILVLKEKNRLANIEQQKKLYQDQKTQSQNLTSTLYEFSRPSANIR